MSRNVCLRVGFLLIVFFSLGAILPNAMAQTETGTIAGRVTDPSGAVVSSATLNLINIENGMKKAAKTNGNGVYVIPNVAPGHYRMRAERDGFKISDLVGLTVNEQDNIEENFRLEVGSASESVTVDASGLNINTTDASVGTVIDRQFVENIPMNGRSFQTLVLLSPGVITNSPQATAPTDAGEFSVNGMRTDSNSNTVDGASASNAPQNVSSSGLTGGLGNTTALGTTQATLMLDAMEQFRISTSTYSAEYGNHPGLRSAIDPDQAPMSITDLCTTISATPLSMLTIGSIPTAHPRFQHRLSARMTLAVRLVDQSQSRICTRERIACSFSLPTKGCASRNRCLQLSIMCHPTGRTSQQTIPTLY